MRDKLFLLAWAVIAAGCGPDKPAPVLPQPDGTDQPEPAEPAPVAPDPVPVAPAPPPDPPPPPPPPPPTPAQLVEQLVATHAAGMKPVGAMVTQTLKEGGVFDQSFTIQSGKCYTIIAASDGITELDAEMLVAQPPLPETSLGDDGMTGSTAVVGGDGKCIKNTLPMSGKGKARLKATKGSGTVVAQIYMK